VARWLIVAALLLLALVLASQLLLPGIAESEVEDRLTEEGGEADVAVSAFPAARLLFDDGDRFQVRAAGLDLDLDRRVEIFDRLDGFADVDVVVEDFDAGPFALSSFALTRDGSAPYRLLSQGEVVPAELVDFGADQLGLPGGGFLGGIAGQALGDAAVPVELDMELTSDEGRVEVTSGGGTIAGLPTGPLAELITAAIVVQL
jgi:hypothetical protein